MDAGVALLTSNMVWPVEQTVTLPDSTNGNPL